MAPRPAAGSPSPSQLPTVEEPPVSTLAPEAAGASLGRNATWTFIGNAAYAACQWATLVALARLVSPERVGQYALGLAVATPVMIFSLLHLRQVLATDACDAYEFVEYRTVRAAATCLGVVVIVAIVGVAGYPLETAGVIVAVGLSKAFDGMSDIYWGLLQKRAQMRRVAISLIVRNVLSLIALVVVVAVSGSVLAGAVASATCSAAVLLGYDVRIAPGGRPGGRERRPGRLRRLAELARKTLPLGVATMLVALNANIPRYFVEGYFGAGLLGVYAAVGSLLAVGITVVTALADSATPRLGQLIAERSLGGFRRLLLKLIAAGVALGAAGVIAALLVGKQVLELLFGTGYVEFDELLLWTMIIAPINYTASFLGYSMTALRLFNVQPFLVAAASAVSVVACLVLVPRHGLLGAVWATGLSLVTQLVGAAAVSAMRLRRTVSET